MFIYLINISVYFYLVIMKFKWKSVVVDDLP
jgi:hypothetical protein